jgi:predicted nucleic acid-binding protein
VSVFVVDASVVVKRFVPEIHSDAAKRLLVLSHEYVAPDLLFAETANLREIPNSAHRAVIVSPSNRRATNRRRSSST